MRFTERYAWGASPRARCWPTWRAEAYDSTTPRAIFAHANFQVSSAIAMVSTVELTVAALGYPLGAAIEQIHGRAAELGLLLCPLELGPHLRLQYLDQPEGQAGQPPSSHRAPPGSLTVASPALTEDDAAPTGFYLRRIEGVLWLRGYCSGPEHAWSPEDHFIFRLETEAA